MIRVGVGVGSFVSGGGTPPVNTVAPVISGTQVVGQTLSTTNGTWIGDPTPSFTYQWYRGATLISGATSNTYVLTQADAGNTSNITCRVTGTNILGSATATSNTLARILDADASSFLTAASISDNTQINACNTLTIDLKAFGIWTKMRAIYPFVGGTASSHRWNLRDPRDLDAAYRLVFSGGITHSSTGALFNGTNGFADSKINLRATFSTNYLHQSVYLRNNLNGLIINGCNGDSLNERTDFGYDAGFVNFHAIGNTASNLGSDTRTDGFLLSFRTGTSTGKFKRNNIDKVTALPNFTQYATSPYYFGARNNNGTASLFSVQQIAFASIGDTLTQTEAANFYTAVQKYQTTLGRHVGVPIVADSDAQAFLNAAEITDVTQANAVDKLVTDLKGFGIWSKMRAIYPFVGGTASSHRFNLKDPRDLDAAFRLVFNGGWTHSSTGALPNGTNGFANTFYSPTAQTSITNTHASLYLRTGSVNPQVDFGSTDDVSYTNRYFMNYYYDSNSYFDLRSRLTIPNSSIGGLVGHINMVRTATNLMKAYKNGNVVGTNTNSSLVYGLPSSNLYLSALNFFGTAISFQNRQLAFATFGDGITDTEAANLYTAIQQYQTTLSRNV